MKFKSRHKLSTFGLAREWVWPRSGWIRWSLYFWRRIWRLADSPHTIAIGFAAGSFASFTPFMGFHFLIGFFAAWLVRGSIIASAIGTSVGNPLTFPLIWFATYNTGVWILGGEARSHKIDLSEMVGHVWNDIYVRAVEFLGGTPAVSSDTVGGTINNAWLDVFWPLIQPMTIGGLILGPVCAAVVYFPVRAAVEAYQHRRRQKLIARNLVPAPRGVDEATS